MLKSKKQIIQIFTLIIFIGFIIAMITFTQNSQNNNPTNFTSNSPSPNNQEINKVKILVKDQKIEDAVKIDEVFLPYSAFVVVHKALTGDKPGLIVGNSDYLDPGAYTDLEIRLTNKDAINSGEVLMITIHPDKLFDKKFTADDAKVILKNSDDKIIFSKITAQ